MTLIRLAHGNLTGISTGPMRLCDAEKDLRLLTQLKKPEAPPLTSVATYLIIYLILHMMHV